MSLLTLKERVKKRLKNYPLVGGIVRFLWHLISSQPFLVSLLLPAEQTEIELAANLLQQGKLDEAIQLYHQLIKESPDWGDAYYNLGNAYLMSCRYQQAIESFEKAMGRGSVSEGLYFNYANALTYESRWEESLEYYQKALSLRPDWVEAHHYYGNILDRLNRFDQASRHWETALSLRPGDMCLYNDIVTRLMFRGERETMLKTLARGYQEQTGLSQGHGLRRFKIRFLSGTWSFAIGHIGLLDYYIKASLMGLRAARHRVLVTAPHQIANRHLLNYWKPYIRIVTRPALVRLLSPLLTYFEDPLAGLDYSDGPALPYFEAWPSVQSQWEQEGRAPLLKLSRKDSKRGWNCLERLGMPKHSWFICLHVREPGFHKDQKGLYQTFRNADIDTYSLAIKTVVDRGGWIVRLGDPSMKPLPPMEGVIDYAHSDLKSDWMDVFLCGACRFYIGTTSGLSHVPPTFGVPCAMTNWTPMGIRSAYSADCFIPKLYWLETEQRYLTFAEAMNPKVGYVQYAPFLTAQHLTAIDNTPEDINDFVAEMLDRVEDKAEYTQEDKQLQQRFDRVARSYVFYPSRIGREFLRKYADLLPEG